MSNPLSVRRVIVQTIDEYGNPEGTPMYGVMAADGYAQSYNDTFSTLDELNAAIEAAGCILEVVNWAEGFSEADVSRIGTKNFYGRNWRVDDPPEES